ncbi:MAG: hypothetical protein BWY99_01456 [Synergistetes bacterium ADurb.BinA166]|jgi:hypothetical protein|nr:MAG: hypothetical protein BWY99_01456 [Synergistetes bacterium ADurb.BinA166]
MSVDDFSRYWRDRLELDLSPFADPGSPFAVTGERKTFTAQWHSRSEPLEAIFTCVPDTGVSVRFQNETYSYRSFLASPKMADLTNLARMILTSSEPSFFVPTRARYFTLDNDCPVDGEATQLLRELLGVDSPSSTRILMVTGQAGSGKTCVLRELIRRQADLYYRKQTDCLYLYINAQGRALARLNEALATELQDLRARLTYHAIAPLVRCGILVPFIDGFDELLGTGGYEDAFSSLAAFVEELNGQGQIVASARSTYYEQEFVSRASSRTALGAQAWTQIPLEVLSWTECEFDYYIDNWPTSVANAAIDSVKLRKAADRVFSGRNAHLRSKPLFVARTAALLARDPDFAGGDDLLHQLVEAFLERERAEKLLDRHGGSLLTKEQLQALLRNLAEEMWNQETRELDPRSLREVAEYVLVTEGASKAVQQIVIEAMPKMALLALGERKGLRFEHEMFFSYFLGEYLAQKVFEDSQSLRMMLGRSILPNEVAEAAVTSSERRCILGKPRALQTALDITAEAASVESPRSNQVRENAGVVALAFLRNTQMTQESIQGIHVARVVIPGGELRGLQFKNCRFERMELRRVDLSETVFENCHADRLVLSDVVVDPETTRLGLIGFDVDSDLAGIRIRDQGLLRGVYDPAERHKLMIDCGLLPVATAPPNASQRQVDSRVVDLVRRLSRLYGRSNPVCTSDDTQRRLFGDPNWPELERLLLQHAVVTQETRQTGGSQKNFLRRRVLPEQLMAGLDRKASVPREVKSFWDALEKKKWK